jgi:UDP-N-acetylmuramoylalanine--D-glutamate ligase
VWIEYIKAAVVNWLKRRAEEPSENNMSENQLSVIIGLGKTGRSCAEHLARLNIPFAITDSRMTFLQKVMPQVPLSLGQFDLKLMGQAKEIIVSQGVALTEPALVVAREKGIPIIGDIELFARAVQGRVVAITGSNGKSTVTSLVGDMVRQAGVSAHVGGNIGIPALDLLAGEQVDCYVLEVSNFQLEVTYSLKSTAATILNISPDHLDHYSHFDDYVAAKQRVYQHCCCAIINRDDPLTAVDPNRVNQIISFGKDEPAPGHFGLRRVGRQWHLAFGHELLMPVDQLRIQGQHNWLNALAALAIGHSLSLPLDAMLTALQDFPGLSHRCAFVARDQDITWYNDSKGTNVGATVAAIEGLCASSNNKIVLLAGGLGKGADFSVLAPVVEKYVRTVILFGQDAALIAAALSTTSVQIIYVNDMVEAVASAKVNAQRGDRVLLSPACASWDMFCNYEHRGDVFSAAVKELLYG